MMTRLTTERWREKVANYLAEILVRSIFPFILLWCSFCNRGEARCGQAQHDRRTPGPNDRSDLRRRRGPGRRGRRQQQRRRGYQVHQPNGQRPSQNEVLARERRLQYNREQRRRARAVREREERAQLRELQLGVEIVQRLRENSQQQEYDSMPGLVTDTTSSSEEEMPEPGPPTEDGNKFPTHVI